MAATSITSMNFTTNEFEHIAAERSAREYAEYIKNNPNRETTYYWMIYRKPTRKGARARFVMSVSATISRMDEMKRENGWNAEEFDVRRTCAYGSGQ